MSLCITTQSIPGDLKEKIKVAAEVGFDKIELYELDFTSFIGDPEELRNYAKSHNVQIAGLQPLKYFEGMPDTKRETSFNRLKNKLAIMQKLGAELLIIQSNSSSDALDDHSKIIADLKEAALLAQQYGVRIAYLALPWAMYIQDEFTALNLIKEVDHPNLGLALNSFYSLAAGAKPAALGNINIENLFHVQLSDAPNLNMDLRHMAEHFRMFPAQGSLNLSGFVSVLAQNGYKGLWSVDKKNDMQPQSEALIAARDGYRSLVNLLKHSAERLPEVEFDIPDLPERTYPSGYEFIEFAVNDSEKEELTSLLKSLCFRMERKHIAKSVELWRQGAVNIVINTEKQGFSYDSYQKYGAGVVDIGLRVNDAKKTVERATKLGAPMFSQPIGLGELNIPAVSAGGGTVIHFVDEKSNLHHVWNIEFEPIQMETSIQPAGLRRVDHIAQTMRYENMQSWLLYYLTTFKMEKTSVVDVRDPSGFVYSQALSSPEGEVRLNLNGAEVGKTFAGTFLEDRFEAGIQHLAFLSDDIFETSEILKNANFKRLEIPPNYYNELQVNFGLDDAFTAKLKEGNILYDRDEKGEYFQIYSLPIFGEFFIEVVQRKDGYGGYGASNAPIRLAAQFEHLQKGK